jgi:hypothetical protein
MAQARNRLATQRHEGRLRPQDASIGYKPKLLVRNIACGHGKNPVTNAEPAMSNIKCDLFTH